MSRACLYDNSLNFSFPTRFLSLPFQKPFLTTPHHSPPFPTQSIYTTEISHYTTIPELSSIGRAGDCSKSLVVKHQNVCDHQVRSSILLVRIRRGRGVTVSYSFRVGVVAGSTPADPPLFFVSKEVGSMCFVACAGWVCQVSSLFWWICVFSSDRNCCNGYKGGAKFVYTVVNLEIFYALSLWRSW